MLANPAAVQARPFGLVHRPAARTEPLPADGIEFKVRPVAPWSRNHLSFRGTRIFTALMLGWAGLILVAFAAIAVPAAHDVGRAGGDPGLMALLGTVAPLIWGLGIVHVVAAVGVARDRGTWGLRLATWMLSAGVLVVVSALVLAVAGRDSFALVDPASDGLALLAWTLGLYALVGWGLRRILAARRLI